MRHHPYNAWVCCWDTVLLACFELNLYFAPNLQPRHKQAGVKQSLPGWQQEESLNETQGSHSNACALVQQESQRMQVYVDIVHSVDRHTIVRSVYHINGHQHRPNTPHKWASAIDVGGHSSPAEYT